MKDFNFVELHPIPRHDTVLDALRLGGVDFVRRIFARLVRRLEARSFVTDGFATRTPGVGLP